MLFFNVYKHGGIKSFILGRCPVIFFFILSGFVLTYSLQKNGEISLTGTACYFIRRIFRLYPAALVSILAGLLASRYLYTNQSPISAHYGYLTTLLDESLSVSTFKEILGSLLLINTNLNGVLWTIQVEYVGSFLLPLLIYISNKKDSFIVIITSVLLLTSNYFITHGSNIHRSYILGYLIAFYLGFLIFRNLDIFIKINSNLAKILILLLCTLLYIIGKNYDTLSATIVLSLLMGVLVPCNWDSLKNALNYRPLILLGKISYSFYVFNQIILIIIFSVMIKTLPFNFGLKYNFILALILFSISVFATAILSILSERFIETPFNNIGYSWSRFLKTKISKVKN